jgi:hypothetical protein
MLNDAILVVSSLVWNPSWFRLTTGIIWAQVWKFERFGACFRTCALIIWSVLLQRASLHHPGRHLHPPDRRPCSATEAAPFCWRRKEARRRPEVRGPRVQSDSGCPSNGGCSGLPTAMSILAEATLLSSSSATTMLPAMAWLALRPQATFHGSSFSVPAVATASTPTPAAASPSPAAVGPEEAPLLLAGQRQMLYYFLN